MKRIPISELGPIQLRRLSRFELQLKLILSELENRELKETTEARRIRCCNYSKMCSPIH